MTFVYDQRDKADFLPAQDELVLETMRAVFSKSFAEVSLDSKHFSFCDMSKEVVKVVREVCDTISTPFSRL